MRVHRPGAAPNHVNLHHFGGCFRRAPKRSPSALSDSSATPTGSLASPAAVGASSVATGFARGAPRFHSTPSAGLSASAADASSDGFSFRDHSTSRRRVAAASTPSGAATPALVSGGASGLTSAGAACGGGASAARPRVCQTATEQSTAAAPAAAAAASGVRPRLKSVSDPACEATVTSAGVKGAVPAAGERTAADGVRVGALGNSLSSSSDSGDASDGAAPSQPSCASNTEVGSTPGADAGPLVRAGGTSGAFRETGASSGSTMGSASRRWRDGGAVCSSLRTPRLLASEAIARRSSLSTSATCSSSGRRRKLRTESAQLSNP